MAERTLPEDHNASVFLDDGGKLRTENQEINVPGGRKVPNAPVVARADERVVSLRSHPQNFARLTSIMVSLTNACNLSCNYCYEQHKKDFGTYTVDSIGKLFEFLTTINDHDSKNLIFFGGEPLIHKKLILSFLEEKAPLLQAEHEKRGFSVNMVTNGLLLTDEFIEKYFSYPFTRMIMSIDTFDATVDQRKIPQKKLDRLKDMIRKIPENVRHDGRVTVRPTISFQTAEGLAPFLDELHDQLGIRAFIMQPLIMGNLSGFLQWGDGQWSKLTDDVKHFIRKHPDIHIEVTEGVGSRSLGSNCLSGYDIISVDPSGDFSGCFFFVNQKEKVGDLMSGNIFTDRLFIDREEKFDRDYRKMFADNEQCRTCNLQDHCYQCPAGNLDTGGTMYRPDGMCQRFVQFYLDMNQEKFAARFKVALSGLMDGARAAGRDAFFARKIGEFIDADLQERREDRPVESLPSAKLRFARHVGFDEGETPELKGIFERLVRDREAKLFQFPVKKMEAMPDQDLLYLTLLETAIYV